MKVLSMVLFSFLLMTTSCGEEKNYAGPLVKPENILKTTMNYLVYNERYVNLWDEFKALDTASNVIAKELFLQQLTTGRFLPLRLDSKDSTAYYQLYKLPPTVDKDIASTVKQYAETDLEHFRMEGTTLPSFNFTDLNGNNYNAETTKGKVMVLKCWYISCVPCVKEMPQLNELVKKYSNRKDFLFVSLAPDPADKLREFLTKKVFDYAVVANQEEYIKDRLKITSFPTHLIVDEKGKILKVLDEYKDLELFLKKSTKLKS